MTIRLSRSAKLYQERQLPQDQQTLRLPGPRLAPSQNAVRTVPLNAPNPTIEAIRTEGGLPPDAGLTKPWPHGDEEQP